MVVTFMMMVTEMMVVVCGDDGGLCISSATITFIIYLKEFMASDWLTAMWEIVMSND